MYLCTVPTTEFREREKYVLHGHIMSGLSIYPTYLGQSKSNGSNTLMPSNKLKKSFFSYEMIEKNTIYFSMLFDHTPVNIMVAKFS